MKVSSLIKRPIAVLGIWFLAQWEQPPRWETVMASKPVTNIQSLALSHPEKSPRVPRVSARCRLGKRRSIQVGGATNSAIKKSRPVTIEFTPERPPATTPAALSM
jgi:hypothetical protein